MSNSSLVSYTDISPMKTKRTQKIDCISIHCMAGNGSLKAVGNLFKTKEASSNYAVDSKGDIAMYVPEDYASWCTSNQKVDQRAVTIEVANDSGEPDWHVSDKAMQSLIKLCADICKRNSIKKLVWADNKTDRVSFKNGFNMPVHRDYAAKACPGNYLMTKMQYIASEVNKMQGVFEYNTLTTTVNKTVGTMIKCDKMDIKVDSGLTITKAIYPYTSRAGDKGVYIEFFGNKKGKYNITDNISSTSMVVTVN